MAICENCIYFVPDRINPEAGLGRCGVSLSHGYFFPAESHVCADHKAVMGPAELLGKNADAFTKVRSH